MLCLSTILMGIMHDMSVTFYSSRVEDEVKKEEKGARGLCEWMR